MSIGACSCAPVEAKQGAPQARRRPCPLVKRRTLSGRRSRGKYGVAGAARWPSARGGRSVLASVFTPTPPRPAAAARKASELVPKVFPCIASAHTQPAASPGNRPAGVCAGLRCKQQCSGRAYGNAQRHACGKDHRSRSGLARQSGCGWSRANCERRGGSGARGLGVWYASPARDGPGVGHRWESPRGWW